jgi:TrbB protein
VTSTDTIRPFGRALYVEFASSGESGSASTLRLDHGLTVSKVGYDIVAQYHGVDGPFLIERFTSEHLAINALRALRLAMQRFARRARRVDLAKAVVLWVVAPFIAALFALGLNAAATRTAGGASVVSSAAPPVASEQQVAAADTAPSPQPPAAAPRAPASEIAKGIGSAIQAGKFSVPLSKGTKGTLYVFSDPLCPHCQDFEKQLEGLAKDYTLHLLPVSVIGGAPSASRIAHVLCTDQGGRAAAWKRLITGGGTPNAEPCARGAQSAAANDQIFRVLGLPGTPAVIAADGRIMPETVALTAAGVDAWMRASQGQQGQ